MLLIIVILVKYFLILCFGAFKQGLNQCGLKQMNIKPQKPNAKTLKACPEEIEHYILRLKLYWKDVLVKVGQ